MRPDLRDLLTIFAGAFIGGSRSASFLLDDAISRRGGRAFSVRHRGRQRQVLSPGAATCQTEAALRDDGSQFDELQRTTVERLVTRDLDEDAGKGRPLSDRARQSVRSVEAYLKGGVRPRWMERVGDIDGGLAHERRLLADARDRLLEACARDGGSFAERWRVLARDWPFPAELVELIDQHNEWYPIERQLPVNPRTGDYVRVNGRSYRRPRLGPGWILEQFPPEAPRG